METLEGRRFYVQTYRFLLLGYIVDSEEFEVKPAIDRAVLMTEFIGTNNFKKKYINKEIELRVVSFTGDGVKTTFSVGEPMSQLFYVEINGLLQERDVDYYHLVGTSKITFTTPPVLNSTITIVYYKANSSKELLIDIYGKVLIITTEYYPNSGLVYTTVNPFTSIIYVTVNGLIQEENVGYVISGANNITFLSPLYLDSVVGISYVY